jgi:putative transposase
VRPYKNMEYDPDIHHRRSIRLKGYDYSQAGGYFVTICTKDRECLFGEIKGVEERLNGAGSMVEKWWQKIPYKFSSIVIDRHIIMPNHFHGIILIVGAALCGRPGLGDHPGLFDRPDIKCNRTGEGAHTGAPLQKIIQWFKTMTTNKYIDGVEKHNWSRFNGKLWQRNYYEHIIRNETELNKIREYIINNPLNWETDENYRTD